MPFRHGRHGNGCASVVAKRKREIVGIVRELESGIGCVPRSARAVGVRERAPLAFLPELKDSVAERPNHSNLCTSEFAQNSVRIQEKFSQFFRNPENSRTSTVFNFLERSAKIREKKCAKFYVEKRISAEILRKIRKSSTNFCEDFEFGAVRKSVYHVDLEER